MANFKEEKSKYLTMPLEQKRILYASKNFAQLSDIPPWSKYVIRNKDNLKLYENNQHLENDSRVNDLVSIWKGDITALEIDAIVNAANRSLLGGSGVDGAIHRAAGPFLRAECSQLGGCKTGEAKITGGYKLPAKYVIHTVGPNIPLDEDPELLGMCYDECLKLMLSANLRTLAFPCISTGIYGYDPECAAHVALSTIDNFLKANGHLVDRIIFVVFLEDDLNLYEKLMQDYFPRKSPQSD